MKTSPIADRAIINSFYGALKFRRRIVKIPHSLATCYRVSDNPRFFSECEYWKSF